MNKEKKALELFGKNFNCCQSVLAPFCKDLELDENTAMRLTTGFGGGVKSGELCGAVSGAIMVLGMFYGHGTGLDQAAKELTTKQTREFIRRFRERHDHVNCRELLDYCMSRESDRAIMKEKGLFDTVCPEFVNSAVKILKEMTKTEL